jgi:serine/threonine protein kinase
MPTGVIGPEYKLISKKGEGTFSEVLKAVAIKNGKYYAIKRMKNHFDRYVSILLAVWSA